MIPDLQYLQSRFDHFNKLIFGGRLPQCGFRIVEARTFRGHCSSKVRQHADGVKEYFDFVISLSCSFDVGEQEIDDTIIHEMIHYFIRLHGLEDSSPHGEIFMAMKNSINRTHKRNIRVSYNLADSDVVCEKKRVVVVCVINFVDGRTGIKVLPRQSRTIAKYKRVVSSQSDVRKITFYVSENPFFNAYPASGALRYHIVDRDKLAAALTDNKILDM